MKAKILLFGLCALSLAACSVDETKQVNDANSVSFKATVPYATRAAATTANSLGSFSVWAWTDGSTFMNHVTATNNGSGTYTTSPLYFWPTTSVDFLGLSPAADGIDGEYVYIGGKYDTPELDDEGEDSLYTGHVGKISVSDDGLGGTILVDVPSSYEDQIDLCYAVATEKSSGSVAMNFRHALSQVVFAARTTNPEMEVEIAGVKICSLYKTGQYTLPSASTATNLDSDELGTDEISSSQGAWTLGTAYGKLSYAAGLASDAVSVPTDGTSVTLTGSDGALFLIPQDVDAWDVLTDHHLTGIGAYFRINCKVTEDGAQIWPNSTEADASGIPDYAEVAIPVEVAWDEGYKYTYTFVFGDGLGYYPPDDPNDPESSDAEATPVLVPISFTVRVDEFQKTDEAEVSTDVDLSYIKVNTAADLAGAVHMGYQTIEIEASTEITLTGYLEFNSDCTLILGEGSTLTGPDGTEDCYIETEEVDGLPDLYYTTIIHVNGCNLTIEGDGTVQTGGTNASDYTCAILVEYGSVTINGGTYKGSNWNGETSELYTRSAVYCSNGGYAYIYGGDFYAGPSNRYSDNDSGYHWVLNCKNSAWNDNNAMIYCYGGTYYDDFDPASPHTDDAPSYVATGYWSVYNETDQTYTVEAVTSPASVSTATNLRDAVAAGASEITVTADVDLLGYLEFNSDCTLTINEGVTVSCPNAADGDNAIDHNGTLSDYTAAIYVNGCNVTIESSGTVGSDGSADACHTNAIWVVNGSVTVNGGTFKGSNWNYTPEATSWSKHAVYCGEGGYAYLNGGTYSCGYTYVTYAESENGYWVLNCHNESELSGNAMIYCTGGSYLNFDPSNPGTDDANSYVVDGYKVTSESDGSDTWYTVSAQ